MRKIIATLLLASSTALADDRTCKYALAQNGFRGANMLSISKGKTCSNVLHFTTRCTEALRNIREAEAEGHHLLIARANDEAWSSLVEPSSCHGRRTCKQWMPRVGFFDYAQEHFHWRESPPSKKYEREGVLARIDRVKAGRTEDDGPYMVALQRFHSDNPSLYKQVVDLLPKGGDDSARIGAGGYECWEVGRTTFKDCITKKSDFHTCADPGIQGATSSYRQALHLVPQSLQGKNDENKERYGRCINDPVENADDCFAFTNFLYQARYEVKVNQWEDQSWASFRHLLNGFGPLSEKLSDLSETSSCTTGRGRFLESRNCDDVSRHIRTLQKELMFQILARSSDYEEMGRAFNRLESSRTSKFWKKRITLHLSPFSAGEAQELGRHWIRGAVLACLHHDKCAGRRTFQDLFPEITSDMRNHGARKRWCGSVFWRDHADQVLAKAKALCADAETGAELAREACFIQSFVGNTEDTMFSCKQQGGP
jgi:hypothetical protein